MLIHMQLEGPPLGTEEAHDLMEAALCQYCTISHLGERYTTVSWNHGDISSSARIEKNHPWQYSAYSNF